MIDSKKTGLPLLSQEIRDRLDARKMTVEQLAKEAEGLSSSSLRSWLTRNTFPQIEWRKIAVVLGFAKDPDAIDQDFSVRWARKKLTTTRAFEQKDEPRLTDRIKFLQDNFADKASRLDSELGQDVIELFKVMHEGDKFYYLSLDEIPIEMKHDGRSLIAEHIADAIWNKAKFTYYFPSEDLLRDFFKWLPELPGALTFTNGFELTREAIIDELVKRKKRPHAEAVKRVNEYFTYVSIRPKSGSSLPFLSPGHKYACFRNHDVMVAFALFPTGTKERNIRLHVPLEKDVTVAFMHFIDRLSKNNK